MNRNQKACGYRSILLFVVSLLAGVGAIEEFGTSSASAQTLNDCKFSFSDPWWSDAGVSVSGKFHCTGVPYPNEITLALEMWYMKFNPQTGQESPEQGCTQSMTRDRSGEVAFSYTCAGFGRGAKVQLRGIATGYDFQGTPFHVEGANEWKVMMLDQ